jgi:uncharacterized protein (TIGR02996 family)
VKDDEALIEAILDDPEDDARRLVYADWLEEHGSFADGIRAQLLRLQLKESQLKEDTPERHAHWVWINNLRERYEWLMVPSLPRGFTNPSIDRGIIHVRVKLNGALFVERGEDYLRGLPPYCRLNLEAWGVKGKGRLMALLGSAAWPRVGNLTVQDFRLSEAERRAFATDARLRGLTELCMRQGNLDDDAVALLADSPHLSRLEELILFDNPIGDAGLRALAQGAGLPRLRSLRLDQGEITQSAAGSFRGRRRKVELFLAG